MASTAPVSVLCSPAIFFLFFLQGLPCPPSALLQDRQQRVCQPPGSGISGLLVSYGGTCVFELSGCHLSREMHFWRTQVCPGSWQCPPPPMKLSAAQVESYPVPGKETGSHWLSLVTPLKRRATVWEGCSLSQRALVTQTAGRAK